MQQPLRFLNVIRSGLIAEIPVAIALALWIWFRADDLVRLSKDLEPGFFVPTTTIEAIRSGYIIWFIVSIVCCLLASGIYFFVSRKWHWRPIYFAVLTIGFAVLISIMAFVSGMTFAVEATGEMLIVAVGFGILIPWLSAKRLNSKSPPASG